MSGPVVPKDSASVAVDRDTFFRAVTRHSCPRCQDPETVFVDGLKQHRCEKCGRDMDGRSLQDGPPPESLRWSTSFREILPVVFGQLFFRKAHTITLGFNYLVDNTAHHKALCATLDTGGLLHIAYADDDIRLKQAAVDRYFVAIRELRRTILLPDADPTMVMLCIIYLQICASFNCIAEAGDGWMVHGAALHRLMRTHASGPLSFEQQTCFSGHMRMFALWNAIMHRKRLDISNRFWVSSFAGSEFSNVVRFNSVLIRVPGALEACDKVCRNRATVSHAAVTGCMALLSALEGELHNCVQRGYAPMSQHQPYWVLSYLAAADDFMKHRTPPSPFSTAYGFANVSTAAVHTNHWMSLLALRLAQLDIRRNVPRSRYPSDVPPFDNLETMTGRAAECADNLCMCVPYLMRSQHGYLGMMCAMGPLHMSINWYRRQNESAKLEWCKDLKEYIHSRGIGTPLAEGERMSTDAAGPSIG